MISVESLLAELENATEVDEVFDIAERLELDIDGDDISLLKIQVKQHLLLRRSNSQQITYHDVRFHINKQCSNLF